MESVNYWEITSKLKIIDQWGKGNYYFVEYQCPNCVRGKIRLEKDNTPGQRDKDFTSCPKCGFNPETEEIPEKLKCPNCESENIIRVGVRKTLTTKKQRYQCKECAKTFYRR